MIDERSMRRPGFCSGTWVGLANGQLWSLPGLSAAGPDLELDATFALVVEAEDHAERLRAELAVTILLLSRNYDLRPADYQTLLEFAPNDPNRLQLQSVVHWLVLGRLRAGRQGPEPKRHEERPALLPEVRSRWPLWFH